MLGKFKYYIIGAGFFGSVLAERIASQKKEKVLIIDKRNHIGGNCYSEFDKETGIEAHKYGSHIFHTDNMKVWGYMSNFMPLNHYRHHVLTKYQNHVYQMPINLSTINRFYNLNLKPYEVKSFMENEIRKENIKDPQNLEEKAISLIGKPLYEAFIKGYTLKQWETDPKKLPADIITRIPVRFNYNSEYFDDPIQGLPIEGYESIFTKLLCNENIEIKLNTDFFDIKDKIPKSSYVIYTGPIDKFFSYKYGKLGWRTIDFKREVVEMDDFQGTPVMNYADETIPYTRIHEFKHLHPERTYTFGKTIIDREYSRFSKENDEPYYPINTREDKERLEQYQTEKIENIFFGGRLGTYKYYDMDDVMESALNFFENVIKKI